METSYTIPTMPLRYDLETKDVLKQLSKANRQLAELKGVASTIPNERILISTLTLQEAKESSEVENIVTTQDDLYKAASEIHLEKMNAATKEVINYREAVQYGYEAVRRNKMLRNSDILAIQRLLVHNDAGFRSIPGTALKRNDGTTVYTPPQDGYEINRLMSNLETFINDSEMSELDPLIKMAIIHHQFESIHPFYDGNGRTGRIVNVLFLVINDLLEQPILYLSRYITQHKAEYYRLIQAIRDKGNDNAKEWETWVIFMLRAVEETARDTIALVNGIGRLMSEYKSVLRPLFGKQYRHELLNDLFFYPYTKIDFLMRDMLIQRKTAARYLDRIVEAGLLEKKKLGRENYYVNVKLVSLFINKGDS